MSAGNLLIPFDFNPVETSFKTSSYTIPAGRYAKATPIDLLCTVDSVSFEEDDSFFSQVTSGGNERLPLPSRASYRFKTGTQSATKTIVYTGSIAGATSLVVLVSATGTTAINVLFKNGMLYQSHPNSSAATVANYATDHLYWFRTDGSVNVTINTINLKEVWVPSGTVLAGGKWLVTEYNVIQ
jgi:hypothetical protein